MTANEQALLAQMQDFGFSHDLCITALQILSQNKLAVSDMLAFIYDERPSEENFIKEMANFVFYAKRFRSNFVTLQPNQTK